MTESDGMKSGAAARDAGLRLMNRLTAASVVAGVAGLGVFGYASAATYAGTPAASSNVSASSAPSSSTPSPSFGLPSSAGSSPGLGVAVTGGS